MMSVVLTIALVICLVNQKQKKQELRRIKSSRYWSAFNVLRFLIVLEVP